MKKIFLLITILLLTLSCHKTSEPKPFLEDIKDTVEVIEGNPSLGRIMRIIHRTQEFCLYKRSFLKKVKIWHDDKTNDSRVQYICDIWK